MTDYPHQDGDVTVIGPECFASADGEVLCWRSENYVKQTDGLRDTMSSIRQRIARLRRIGTFVPDEQAQGTYHDGHAAECSCDFCAEAAGREYPE